MFIKDDDIVRVIEENDIDSGAYFYTEIEGSYSGEKYLRQSLEMGDPDAFGLTWPFISGIVTCLFYFWQLKRYAKGRKTFAENFLITRERALDEALRSAESGKAPDIEALVQASDIPAKTRQGYRPWVTLLVEHYRDLLLAHGSSYPALVKSTYKTRTNYLLFLNRLNQVEQDFDSALKPHLETPTEDVNGIIKLMEESVTSLRRQLAEAIFP